MEFPPLYESFLAAGSFAAFVLICVPIADAIHHHVYGGHTRMSFGKWLEMAIPIAVFIAALAAGRLYGLSAWVYFPVAAVATWIAFKVCMWLEFEDHESEEKEFRPVVAKRWFAALMAGAAASLVVTFTLPEELTATLALTILIATTCLMTGVMIGVTGISKARREARRLDAFRYQAPRSHRAD